MFKPTRMLHPLLNMINKTIMDLPTPSSISLFWNFGSLLGLSLITQITTGIFLSMHYLPNTNLAFYSVIHISHDVILGWLIQLIHANTASFFFICLYLHVGRGMYYMSYKFLETWSTGMLIMFSVMATAFLGYVLPWGQMSFWGATVITNLVSALPFVGITIVEWLWGGFAVSNATLTRFFSLHFMIPFVISAMVIIHLLFLHQTGSSNPLGLKINIDKMSFHSYFSTKDVMGFTIMIMILFTIILTNPFIMMDPDNYTPANPLLTPIHIQPEWYFLFAYAILRSIPNKLGGVIFLMSSIMILAILPFIQKSLMKGNQFFFINKTLFWLYFNTTLLLTWIGARPVETPYIATGQMLTIIYFSYFLINSTFLTNWFNFIKTPK